ncbi:MAG: Holliday junction resolvase RuvX [Acidobacteriota bacterium]
MDFGLRRIGVAVSDALGITAQGLPTLQRTSIRKDIDYIRAVAEEYSVQKVLVGNPVGHAGGPTAMSRHAEEFAKKLRSHLSCPVELWDERLTSVEANRMLRSTGLSIGKRRQAVDRVAAVLLLQNYLDLRANELEGANLAGESL